jgi:hypothetical protein
VNTVERDVFAARGHYDQVVADLTRVWQSGLPGTSSLVDLLVDEFNSGLDARFVDTRGPLSVPRPRLPEDDTDADDEVYDHLWAHLIGPSDSDAMTVTFDREEDQ